MLLFSTHNCPGCACGTLDRLPNGQHRGGQLPVGLSETEYQGRKTKGSEDIQFHCPIFQEKGVIP